MKTIHYDIMIFHNIHYLEIFNFRHDSLFSIFFELTRIHHFKFLSSSKLYKQLMRNTHVSCLQSRAMDITRKTITIIVCTNTLPSGGKHLS